MLPVSTHRAFVATLLAASCSAWVSAQDRTEESFIPNFTVASAYYSWTGDADFSDAAGSLSQQEAGIGADLPLWANDRIRITTGFLYRWNQLEFDLAPAPLHSLSLDLHRLDIPINAWVDLSDRWKLWLRLQPGLYSDFDNLSSEDFMLTSLALFSYRWSEWLKIAFGAFYSRETGDERILPALGLIIEPGPHWSLALTFPRMELAYAPTPDWLISARAVLSGGGWNITDPAGSTTDVDLNFQSVRIGLGVDRRLAAGPWWAYVDAGVQLAQEIEIEGAGYEFSQDLDPTAYVTSGLRLRF
jgi:hypothetical protein